MGISEICFAIFQMFLYLDVLRGCLSESYARFGIEWPVIGALLRVGNPGYCTRVRETDSTNRDELPCKETHSQALPSEEMAEDAISLRKMSTSIEISIKLVVCLSRFSSWSHLPGMRCTDRDRTPLASRVLHNFAGMRVLTVLFGHACANAAGHGMTYGDAADVAQPGRRCRTSKLRMTRNWGMHSTKKKEKEKG